MKVLIDILHPAHVHKFKNIIKILEERGHKVYVTARDKEVTIQLLNTYNIPFTCWKKGKEDLIGKFSEFFLRLIKLFFYCKKFKPDVLLGFGGLFIVPVGKILRIPTVISCEEAEYRCFTNLINSLSTVVCTPYTFKKSFGKKHIRFNGFAELSYLQNFKPNPNYLSSLGLNKKDNFFVIRVVSWKAIHDFGHKGFDEDLLVYLVEKLSKSGRVLISAEGLDLPQKLKPFVIKIKPEYLHSILYYSQLFIGDGQIVAVEAGLLGTPAIRFNTLVGSEHDCGKFNELDQMGIVYSVSDKDELLKKVDVLLQDKNAKFNAIKTANLFLDKKDDVTLFFVDLLEKMMFNKK